MKKDRRGINSLIIIITMTILTFTLMFTPICVHTIGDNYLNDLITNQVSDMIIDQNTSINYKQLTNIQNKIKNSKALYQYNKANFSYTINNLNTKLSFKTNDNFINYLQEVIYKEIQLNIDQEIINNCLKDKQLYMIINNKLANYPIIKIIYKIIESIIFKMFLLLIILYNIFLLYKNNIDYKLLMGMIFICQGIINYIILGLIEISKTFISNLINIQINVIFVDSYIIVSMICLLLGIILIYKTA